MENYPNLHRYMLRDLKSIGYHVYHEKTDIFGYSDGQDPGTSLNLSFVFEVETDDRESEAKQKDALQQRNYQKSVNNAGLKW